MKRHNRSVKTSKGIFSLLSLTGLGKSGWAIIILSVAIMTLIGSMIISPVKSYRAKASIDTVTLQILNGCGIRGAAESLSDALLPGDGEILYDVIEKGDAKLGAFDKTVVVDRRGSVDTAGKLSEQAIRVAERMGVDEKDVLLLRLEDNILDIDVTVIAGADYADYVQKLKKGKEGPL